MSRTSEKAIIGAIAFGQTFEPSEVERAAKLKKNDPLLADIPTLKIAYCNRKIYEQILKKMRRGLPS